MRIAAWDTSTSRATVAFYDEEAAFVAERCFEADRRLARHLLPAVQTLEMEAWPLSSSDLIAVGIGPGSFTGLRVALAAAKAAAFVAGVPIIGISSLMVLAAEAEGDVVVVADARGGAFYYARYDVTAGEPVDVLSPSLATADEIKALAAALYVGPSPSPPGRDDTSDFPWREVWPDAATLARLGAAAFRRNGPVSLGMIKPLYIKRGQV